MESSAYNLILLLLGELNKVYCVAGYTDGKLWIFLRMLLCIYKSLPVKYPSNNEIRLSTCAVLAVIAITSFLLMLTI